jgi:hypothetical protein
MQLGPEPNEVDEIAILEARRLSILDDLESAPMTAAQCNEAVDELAEIETCLQKHFVGLQHYQPAGESGSETRRSLGI